MQAILKSGARTAPLAFTFVVLVTSQSFFVTQLDVTIVNVALPRIAHDLSARVAHTAMGGRRLHGGAGRDDAVRGRPG